jgi:DNA end-binding protein Ku
MPRSIWNGTVSFGLIAVPIKVHSATQSHTIHFHQVHEKDGARIRQKRICSKEGKEVPYEEVGLGYEVRGGEFVMLSQEEIDAAAGERSRVIALEEFVDRDDVDPVFYDRTYYLGAGQDGEDAYRLLHDALKRTERSGIGRWVFHNREYLVAVRSADGVLVLHTMRFADELVDPGDLDIPRSSRTPAKRELDMAAQLVDSLNDRFRPSAFKDTYRDRVGELIARKANGEEIELSAPEPAEAPDDLLAALEASLGKSKGRKSSGSRGGRSRSGSGASRKRRSNSGARS